MKEIDFLKEVVKNATNISKQKCNIETKGGEEDLVTNLDLEIERYIISKIKEEYPNFDIVSEEYNNQNIVTDNCFIIDPVDGTINFANHLPLWGIQVACVKNGKTIASVICLPKLNEFYYADETGAYLNEKKITIKTVPLKNVLYAVNDLPSMNRMRKHSSNRRNFGSLCVSMAFVASGRIHGAVFRIDNPWDYEPGLFICKMAGASVKSIDGFHAAAMNQDFLDILEQETAKKSNMSNVFILHSLSGDTLKMWGQDIKETFSEKEIEVFMPEFPIIENSNYESFKEILSFYIQNGQLNHNSIVVAHSISNPYFIRFCREIKFEPKAYIAVAPEAIYNSLVLISDSIGKVKEQAYINQEDLRYIKNMTCKKYCFYSDEDNNNNEIFTCFIEDIDAKDCYLQYYSQFDGYHRIYKIPELNELINKLL